MIGVATPQPICTQAKKAGPESMHGPMHAPNMSMQPIGPASAVCISGMHVSSINATTTKFVINAVYVVC